MPRVRMAVETPAACGCGCGRLLPVPRRPDRRWASGACKARATARGIQAPARDLSDAEIERIYQAARAQQRYARAMGVLR